MGCSVSAVALLFASGSLVAGVCERCWLFGVLNPEAQFCGCMWHTAEVLTGYSSFQIAVNQG